MNPNQLNRDSTYPMKSITPIKKPKVLQTFGNEKFFYALGDPKKPIKEGNMNTKINFFSYMNS